MDSAITKAQLDDIQSPRSNLDYDIDPDSLTLRLIDLDLEDVAPSSNQTTVNNIAVVPDENSMLLEERARGTSNVDILDAYFNTASKMQSNLPEKPSASAESEVIDQSSPSTLQPIISQLQSTSTSTTQNTPLTEQIMQDLMRLFKENNQQTTATLGQYQLQLDSNGLFYITDCVNCSSHWALPIGWVVRNTELGPMYYDTFLRPTFYNPFEVMIKNETHARKLGMSYEESIHTCKHCDKIMIDCRVSKLRSFHPRPLQGRRVKAASDWAAVAEAQADNCALFLRLFPTVDLQKDQIWRKEPSDSDGICLEIGGYSNISYLEHKMSDKLGGAWEYQRLAHVRKKLAYDIVYEKSLKEPLVLCSDPDSLDYDSRSYSLFGGPLNKSSVNDEQTWEWIMHQLNQCIEDHDECGHASNDTGSVVPTYLIDATGYPSFINIVCTNTFPTKIRDDLQWVCLSYSWGPQSQRVQTKSANLSQNLKDILVKDLSPTIRDAVHVTRILGLHYLWIDAICIVQDDDDMKIGELAVMDEIYRNAVLTIVAGCSSGVEEGFFYDKGYYHHQDTGTAPIRLGCLDSNGKVGTLVAYQSCDNTEGAVDFGNPTEERGWTFQERMLSRRVLYYGIRGLAFICRQTVVRNGDSMQNIEDPEFGELTRRIEKPAHSIYSWNWWQMVEDYTARGLTKPEDKLTAISAIAKLYSPPRRTHQPRILSSEEASEFWDHVKSRWTEKPVKRKIRPKQAGYMKPDMYAAGLMRNAHDLAWYVMPEDCKQTRPTGGYRAPTWSWASIDNKVTYWANDKVGENLYLEHHIRRLHMDTAASAKVDFSVTPAIQRLPFGPVIEGSVRILGPYVPVYWLQISEQKHALQMPQGFSLTAFPDCVGEIHVGPEHKLTYRAVTVAGNHDSQWCGLVLQIVTDGATGEKGLRRVGFWRCCDNDYHYYAGQGDRCQAKMDMFHMAASVMKVE